jgi:predicted nuclease with TOPRIM domain
MSDDPIMAALARLESGQATLQADLKSVRIDFLAELGQTRADIMGKIEDLQHRLAGLDDHLTMGLGNSDRVERQSDGVAEQNRLLGEQMTTMHKIIRRLEGRINDLEDRK